MVSTSFIRVWLPERVDRTTDHAMLTFHQSTAWPLSVKCHYFKQFDESISVIKKHLIILGT